MKIKTVIALGAFLLAVNGCSSRTGPRETYVMPKGAMSSIPHTMTRPKEDPSPNATPDPQGIKKGSSYMPKGGMSSVGHEMK